MSISIITSNIGEDHPGRLAIIYNIIYWLYLLYIYIYMYRRFHIITKGEKKGGRIFTEKKRGEKRRPI